MEIPRIAGEYRVLRTNPHYLRANAARADPGAIIKLLCNRNQRTREEVMNLRQKYYVYLCVCLLLSGLALGLSLTLSAALGAQAAGPSAEPVPAAAQTEAAVVHTESVQTAAASQTAEAPPLYTVRAVGDEVRIIPYGNEDAYRVLPDIDVRTLRKVDAAALRAGIELYTEEELAAFLEDFGS